MFHRFRHARQVEVALVGLIVAVVLGFGIYDGGQGARNRPAAASSGVVGQTGETLPLAVPAELGITVKPTRTAAPFSQDEAMQILATRGIPFSTVREWKGEPVTVTAVYGAVTQGKRGPNGAWIGRQHVLLSSGMMLAQIENRPAWVLVYDHAKIAMPAGDQVAVLSHTLYVIDAETQDILVATGFAGPGE